jgi:hypothetical protein
MNKPGRVPDARSRQGHNLHSLRMLTFSDSARF